MTLLNKITNFIDEVFKIVCIFLAAFVWSLYIKKELSSALVLSTLISIVTLFLIHFVFTNKKQKSEQKKIKQKNYTEFCHKLKLSSQKERMNFFSLLYPDYSLVDSYLQKDKSIIYPALKENLSEDELFTICSLFSEMDYINILCFSFSKSTELISKKILPLKVNITPIKEVFYSSPEQAQNYQPKLNISNAKLYTFKLLIISAFSPDKAKKYLLLSFVLTLSLFFLPYKLLYAILATLALIFAFLCKTNLIK